MQSFLKFYLYLSSSDSLSFLLFCVLLLLSLVLSHKTQLSFGFVWTKHAHPKHLFLDLVLSPKSFPLASSNLGHTGNHFPQLAEMYPAVVFGSGGRFGENFPQNRQAERKCVLRSESHYEEKSHSEAGVTLLIADKRVTFKE